MRSSLVVGPTDVPLLDRTIGGALDDAVKAWGERDALIDRGQGVRLSWAALAARAEAFGAGLIALGLAPGDRVGVWSLNRVEWVIAQFATAKAGLVLVSINPAYRLSELDHALRLSGYAAMIIAPPFKSCDYPAMIASLLPPLAGHEGDGVISPRFPDLRHIIQMGPATLPAAMGFDDVERAGATAGATALRERTTAQNPGDAVNIQFTSGTTGSPKGGTLSHRNILNNGYFVGRGINLGPDDRLCIPVPLYHCFGLSMGNLACLTHGAAMVCPGEGFDPVAALEAVAAEHCTALYGVPTMFIAELDHPRFDDFDLSCCGPASWRAHPVRSR